MVFNVDECHIMMVGINDKESFVVDKEWDLGIIVQNNFLKVDKHCILLIDCLI